MQAQFEATPQQKQLADLGRAMMDYSEEYGAIHGLARVTDQGLRTLNDLSHVGYMLTRVGASFGTTLSSFTAQQIKLIEDFGAKEVDIQRR